jgi:hypothetical protein
MNRPPTSLSAVSPGTFLFLDQNHITGGLDDPNVARTIDKRSEIDQRTLGSREATRLRWEELKPLIQRVYIDEDKPYPYLANLLRTEHRFETTYGYPCVSLVGSEISLTHTLESVSSRER